MMPRLVDDTEREMLPAMRELDEIEALAEKGWCCFGQRVIDEEAFFLRMTRLRSLLPSRLQEAVDLVRAREQLAEEAGREADEIREPAQTAAEASLVAARQQVAHLDEEAQSQRIRLLQEAERRAQRCLAEAQQQAEQLLANHSLIVRAEQNAAASRQNTAMDIRELQAETIRYTTEVLERVGAVLTKLQLRIQQDKHLLNGEGANSVR